MSRARDIADIHDGSTDITTLGTVTTGTFNSTIGSSASFPSNQIIQVVSENFENTSTASGTSEVVSFITKDITSSKLNSKFLVMVNSITGADDGSPIIILRRTISSSSTDIATSAGITMRSDARLGNVRHGINFHLSYVDSPTQSASTSINYKIILKGLNASQDTFLGRTGFSSGDTTCLSSITIMELAP